jgi:hypothetical protein
MEDLVVSWLQKVVKIYNLFVLLLKLIDNLQCFTSMVISFNLKLFKLFSNSNIQIHAFEHEFWNSQSLP